MKPLHEQCAELAKKLGGYATGDEFQRPVEQAETLLRHLSTVLRNDGLADERISKLDADNLFVNYCPGDGYYVDGERPFARAIEQETAAPLLAKIAESESARREAQADLERYKAEVCRLQPMAEQRDAMYHEGYAKGRGDGYEHGYKVGWEDAMNRSANETAEVRQTMEALVRASAERVSSQLPPIHISADAESIRALIDKERK